VCAIITSILDAIGLQQMEEVILHNLYDSIRTLVYLFINIFIIGLSREIKLLFKQILKLVL